MIRQRYIINDVSNLPQDLKLHFDSARYTNVKPKHAREMFSWHVLTLLTAGYTLELAQQDEGTLLVNATFTGE